MHKLLFITAVLVHQGMAGQGLPAGNAFYRDWSRFSVRTPAGPPEARKEVFALDGVVHTRHKVVPGDTVASLASAYRTDVKSLQGTNKNEFVLMRNGGFVRVHNNKGYLYEAYSDKETLADLLRRYKQDSDDPKFKEHVVELNALPPSALLGRYNLYRGQRILLPGVSVPFDGYNLPVHGGWRISSGFGYRRHPILHRRAHHRGWDIPKPLGTTVYPSRSGVVTYAGWEEGYGNLVEVAHSDGASTRYGHLGAISVSVGQRVEKNKTKLGEVGQTGWTTGPHLHFEIRDKHGRAVNPYYKIGRR